MPKFILMTKLGPEVTANLRARKAKGQKWMKAVSEKCPGVKWLTHYALLGPYDFMDIYEAPDSETAAKVSLLTRSLGASSAESWTAVEYTDFVNMIKDM